MILFLSALVIFGITGYVIIRIFRKESKNSIRQLELSLAFDRMIRREKLSIEHAEWLNGRVIAIDRRNRKLVIIDHRGNEKVEECISLLEVDNCRMIETRDGGEGRLKRISIELSNRGGNAVTRFCFYIDGIEMISELPARARVARFWKQRIEMYRHPGGVPLEFEYVI